MSTNQITFADGTRYSLTTALNSWTKGGNRLLSAVINETISLAHNSSRNATNLNKLVNTVGQSENAMRTVIALVKVLSEGSIVWNKTENKAHLKKELKIDPAAAHTMRLYEGQGFSYANSEMHHRLGIGVKAETKYDLQKKTNAFVNKAMEMGFNADQIKKAVEQAITANATK